MSQSPTRRSMLAALSTVAATAIAGCSNNAADQDGSNSNQSTTNQTPDVFATIESVPGDLNAKLRVSITDDADVNAIALHDSNDMQKQRQSLGAGSTVEFALNQNLDSGTYDLVAIKDGEEVTRRSVDLDRKLAVKDVRIYAPDGEIAQSFEVDLQNTGDFRLEIDEMGLFGDAPDPHAEPLVPAPDPISDEGESKLWLSPEETSTFRMENTPLQTDITSEGDLSKGGCTGKEREGTIRISADKNSFTKHVNVTYKLSGGPRMLNSGHGCPDWSVQDWSNTSN